MRYLYLNIDENRIVTMTNKRHEELAKTLTEYIVPDTFDLTKDIPLKEGQKPVKLEGFLTAQEFIERFNNNYSAKRVNEYPSIEQQLDDLYHNGIDGWRQTIQIIKNKHQK